MPQPEFPDQTDQLFPLWVEEFEHLQQAPPDDMLLDMLNLAHSYFDYQGLKGGNVDVRGQLGKRRLRIISESGPRNITAKDSPHVLGSITNAEIHDISKSPIDLDRSSRLFWMRFVRNSIRSEIKLPNVAVAFYDDNPWEIDDPHIVDVARRVTAAVLTDPAHKQKLFTDKLKHGRKPIRIPWIFAR